MSLKTVQNLIDAFWQLFKTFRAHLAQAHVLIKNLFNVGGFTTKCHRQITVAATAPSAGASAGRAIGACAL